MVKPLSFSQRMGLKPIKVDIQTNGIDNELRIALWNMLCEIVWPEDSNTRDYVYNESDLGKFLKAFWVEYHKQPLDELSFSWYEWLALLKDIFLACAWNEVYDFLQFVLDFWPNNWFIEERFVPACNRVLEAELSGYRIIGRVIAPITSDQEKNEIEEALTDTSKLTPIRLQLEQALRKLSDRDQPDYRGSIKESISSVETLCRIVTKQPKLELGKALKQIESKGTIGLHPALKDAFIKLYGWTSDDGGIRHALMDEPKLEFEDAKFMLVSCSAFINYMLAKLAKAGIEI